MVSERVWNIGMKSKMNFQSAQQSTQFTMYNMWEIRESFPNAYAISGNKLYFSTLFDNILYEMNLDNEDLKEYFFPVACNKVPCYRFAISYKDVVLFVPEYEGFFSCLQSGKIFTIPAKGHYASGCIKNEELFLLDRSRFCLDVFNLITLKYTDTVVLPTEDNSNYYIEVLLGNEFLYVTSGIDCQILQIDIHSRKIEAVKTDALICHGILENGEIYYTSTRNDLDGIYVFNLNSRKSKRIASIEYDNRNEIKYYRFWNAKKIGEYIYFLPHEESKIIRYDIITKKVDYFAPFDDNYRTLRPDKSNAVYGIVQYKNDVVIIPYFGNLIYVLDYKGNVINAYQFSFSTHQRRCALEKKIEHSKNNILWETTGLLSEYIDCITYRDTARRTDRNLGFVGSKIYKEIKGDID